MGARDIHNYVSAVFKRRKRKNRAPKEEEKIMSIEDATKNLRNNNQSGLDKRLLLPSVEAKEATTNVTSENLLGSINTEILRLTATVSDKNDLIIDQLVELNSQIKDGKFGGGERENMLQTLFRTPGRAISGGVKMGQSALRRGTDLLMSPLNLIKSAGSSALGAVTAAPKAVGSMIGNLFQSKSMKALVEVNQKQLTEQTAIKDGIEDIAKDVADIAKMMEQELKIKRRGRLDALEAQRDARGNKPGLIGASRVGTGTKATANLRNRPPKSPDGAKPGIIGAVTSSVSNFITNPIGAAATALTGSALFQRFRNRNNAVPGAGAPDIDDGPNNRRPTLLERARGVGSRVAGFAKRAVPGATAAIGALELGKTFIDREATFDDKIEETAGATGGIVGGVAGAKAGALGGAALGAALGSVVPILGTAAGGAIGGFIGAAGGGLLGYMGGDFAGRFLGSQQFRDRRRVENIEKEKFNSPEEAAQVAEQLGIDDYEIVQQERRTFFAKKKMIYRIKPAEPNPTADLENMPSPTDEFVGLAGVSDNTATTAGNQIVTETDLPVIELKITPNLNTQTIQEMFDGAIDKYMRERNILLDNQEEMLNTDQSPQSNINITPISDNRASNVSNNITTLNKVALSSIDQTNKVVPI